MGKELTRGPALFAGPSPLFLAPPNGTCGSAPADSEFTCRMPTSTWSTADKARVRSFVNIAADKPYSLSFANLNASSVSAARRTAKTGPNNSSVQRSTAPVPSSMMVGAMK